MADDEGFREFVHARLGRLSRTAFLLTGDHHAAEDLVQDALARTCRVWRRLADGGNPEAYVRRVMYHLQISRWRRKRLGEVGCAELPERAFQRDHAVDIAERLSLRAALLALPPRQRAVIVLRYFEDQTEAQTADVLGCQIGTVKSNAFRALSRLRTLIPDLESMDTVRWTNSTGASPR
jgi:RNA polymerase sigma-70 factor (sigma-E family)